MVDDEFIWIINNFFIVVIGYILYYDFVVFVDFFVIDYSIFECGLVYVG